jgi:hypothetical protein
MKVNLAPVQVRLTERNAMMVKKSKDTHYAKTGLKATIQQIVNEIITEYYEGDKDGVR